MSACGVNVADLLLFWLTLVFGVLSIVESSGRSDELNHDFFAQPMSPKYVDLELFATQNIYSAFLCLQEGSDHGKFYTIEK